MLKFFLFIFFIIFHICTDKSSYPNQCVEYLMANQKVNDQDNEISEYIGFLNHHPEYITVTNIEPIFKMELYLDELMKSNLKIFQIQLNLNCENISLNDIPPADIEAIFHYNRTDIENFNTKFQNVLNTQNTKVTNYEENVAERI